MEIKEMTIEDIESRMSEISTEIDSADEERLDALEVEIRDLNDRKEELRKAAEAAREERAKVLETGTVVEEYRTEEKKNIMEVRNSKEYIDAYAEYIKTNDPTECRTLLTENVSGQVAVPELVEDIIRNAWENEGIMSLVRKSYIKGNLKVGFEISADGAVIHTEGDEAPTEEHLVLGIVELVPQSIKKWITLSDESYDLRGEAFLRYVYSEVAHQIAKKAADTLIAKIEACGEASTNTPTTNVGVPILEAATIAVDTIAQAVALLSDQAQNPTIMMNKATWGAFKAVQYANKYAVDPFEGLPVKFNNTIAAYNAASTGDTYAIVGDLGYGALANFPNGEGITFKYDDLSLAEADLIKIVGREYAAIGVVAPQAFVKIQK